MVGTQTGIYPARVHPRGLAPDREDPFADRRPPKPAIFPIAAGDELRFKSIDESEYRARFGGLLESRPGLGRARVPVG